MSVIADVCSSHFYDRTTMQIECVVTCDVSLTHVCDDSSTSTEEICR